MMNIRAWIAVLLLVCSSAHCADFDFAYVIKKGDFDSDGRMDLFFDYAPTIVSVEVDDIAIPVPLSRRHISSFVLRQLASGNFQQLAVPAADVARLRSWPRSTLRLTVVDINSDQHNDALVANVASELSGAKDFMVLAPTSEGALPTMVRNVDTSVTSFMTDLNGAITNPAYFDSGWNIVSTTYYNFTLDTYSCGGTHYPDLTPLQPDDDPWGPPVSPGSGLPNGGQGCVYVGTAVWSVPIDLWEFDDSAFSEHALNVYYALRTQFGQTGASVIPRADAQAVLGELEELFGMSFGAAAATDVVLNPTTTQTAKWGWLVEMGAVARLANILAAIFVWTDTAANDEVWGNYIHYSYLSYAASLHGPRGLWRGSFVTAEPLVSGSAAQQLYALPPKDPADSPPNAWYSIALHYTIPRVPITEIPLSFPHQGGTVYRTGGGTALRIGADSGPGTVQGPFRLPPI